MVVMPLKCLMCMPHVILRLTMKSISKIQKQFLFREYNVLRLDKTSFELAF